MLDRINRRIATGQREGGFTLIELLVVIIIIGILLAIAIPSYLSFRSRANASAAQANVRAAVPGAEAWYADNGNYDGLTETTIKTYDQGIKNVVIVASGQTYCITSTVGDRTFGKANPAADITEGVACGGGGGG